MALRRAAAPNCSLSVSARLTDAVDVTAGNDGGPLAEQPNFGGAITVHSRVRGVRRSSPCLDSDHVRKVAVVGLELFEAFDPKRSGEGLDECGERQVRRADLRAQPHRRDPGRVLVAAGAAVPAAMELGDSFARDEQRVRSVERPAG